MRWITGPSSSAISVCLVAYGVRPEHYPIVGAVLLETFSDVLGDRWTRAYHDAWADAYEVVCALMLEGASVPTPA